MFLSNIPTVAAVACVYFKYTCIAVQVVLFVCLNGFEVCRNRIGVLIVLARRDNQVEMHEVIESRVMRS